MVAVFGVILRDHVTTKCLRFVSQTPLEVRFELSHHYKVRCATSTSPQLPPTTLERNYTAPNMNKTTHHCECARGDCHLRLRAATDRAMRNPVAAIKAISNGRPNPFLFTAMINLPLEKPHVIYFGLTTIFIKYLVDGYQPAQQEETDQSIDQDAIWTKPVQGLINVLASIINGKETKRNSTIVHEIRAAYPEILATLWRDLDCLVLPGHQADIHRGLVLHLMTNLARIEGLKRLCSTDSGSETIPDAFFFTFSVTCMTKQP